MIPYMNLPTGNSAPYTYIYVLMDYVLFLIGLRFSARSLLITPQIGAIEDIIGTRTPIKNPPSIDAKVGYTL